MITFYRKSIKLCVIAFLAPFLQASIYRFIGYFSKQVNQNVQQPINNLACLFILPPFAQRQEYSQVLIAFSYFLMRLDASNNLMYCSPARPLDIITLSVLRKYWHDTTMDYIINHNQSTTKRVTLNTLARQTFIHPHDILLSLYSNASIVSHPTDKSSVYLLNNAYSMTSLNLHIKNKLLYMDTKLIGNDDQKKMIIDKER